MMFAQVSNLEVGELVHVISDAHIYDRHIPALKEMFKHEQFEAPKLIMNKEVKNFYDFTVDRDGLIHDVTSALLAFAGDFRAAHAAGVDFLRFYCAVPAVYGDIVVTSNGGAPLDQNLYQCVKGMTAAEAACNPGGTIILCAEIADGMGGESFYQQLKGCESPAQLYEQFSLTPQAETAPDQWQSQILARVLMHHRVIVVTSDKMREKILEMKMEHAETLPEALTMAGEGTLTVIPDGVSLIVTK